MGHQKSTQLKVTCHKSSATGRLKTGAPSVDWVYLFTRDDCGHPAAGLIFVNATDLAMARATD